MLDNSNLHYFLEQNGRFFNVFQGRTVAILGNGSSLNDVEPSRLSDKVIVTVNSFYKTKLALSITPFAHVFIDPIYTNNSLQDSINLNRYLCKFERYPISFTRPDIFNSFLAFNSNFDISRVGILAYDPFQSIYHFDLRRALPPLTMNVLCAALTISLFIGGHRIELYGFDHEFLKPQEVEGRPADYLSHAYSQDAACLELEAATPVTDLSEHLKNVSRLLSEYAILKKLSEMHSRCIVDLTPGGALNSIFP